MNEIVKDIIENEKQKDDFALIQEPYDNHIESADFCNDTNLLEKTE